MGTHQLIASINAERWVGMNVNGGKVQRELREARVQFIEKLMSFVYAAFITYRKVTRRLPLKWYFILLKKRP